jgi:hypothetical protein
MRKLIIPAFALAAAVLLASFMPRSGGTADAPSLDPHAMTIASPALPTDAQPDAF